MIHRRRHQNDGRHQTHPQTSFDVPLSRPLSSLVPGLNSGLFYFFADDVRRPERFCRDELAGHLFSCVQDMSRVTKSLGTLRMNRKRCTSRVITGYATRRSICEFCIRKISTDCISLLMHDIESSCVRPMQSRIHRATPCFFKTVPTRRATASESSE